jgi:hypothetical protein
MELRVYYESLEQSLHYLINDLKKLFPQIDIILVKKCQQSFNKNGFSKEYSKNLSKILIRKNPDLIITIIDDNVEYPLCVIEFSTAVFTKDHEQQRSDNFQIPIRNNVFYIKVSATKKDSGNHGGDTSYNYLEPFSLCFKKYRKLPFHIEWDVDELNRKFVRKNEKFKSIPHQNSNFIELVSIIIKSYLSDGYQNYEEKVISLSNGHSHFKNWINNLTQYSDYEDLKSINSKRTEWYDFFTPLNKSNVFVLKFNRMGHAMDPERGMLTHYNTFFGDKGIFFVSKLVFDKKSESWFKSTPKEKEIREKLSKISNIEKSDLIDFFIMGLSIRNSSQLLNILGDLDENVYDISQFVNDNFQFLNSALRTIFENSKSLFLSNGLNSEVFLTWEGIQPDFDYTNLPDVTSIQKRISLSEDDVTYITMNEVFRVNEIVPVSVSYPGAQSDTPVLPDTKSGRSQLRTYIDSVGFKNDSILLQENKGSFNFKEISTDISKILKFKEDQNYIDAIFQFSVEQNLKVKNIIIGVGFGYTKQMLSKLRECGIDKVDYFLVISENLDSWKIFSNIDDNIFPIKTSKISYPLTFEVV